MLRYVFAILLANAVFSPAAALTVDSANGFESGALGHVNWDQTIQGSGQESGRPTVDSRFGAGQVEPGARADFITHWTLALAAENGSPVTLVLRSGEVGASTDVRIAAITKIPLPPAVWLFLTALATGLALIRRRRTPG